jgi:hypothetical protein
MSMIRTVKQLISRRRPPPLSGEEAARIALLRRTMADLPSLDGQAPDSAAAAEWLGNRRRLRQLVAESDPRQFLEWDVIHKTMFVANAPYVRQELAELRQSPRWQDRWKPAHREDAAGCPPRCRWSLGSSGNLIHHAYHLLRAETMLGKTIDQFDRIVEFGGGYGSFCRLAWRLGFRGRYVIFDLPEFSALQRFYLAGVGIPAAASKQESGVRCVSDLAELSDREPDSKPGLFFGFWSISETPVDFRGPVLAKAAALGNVFIGYQDRFQEVDNVRFFAEWVASQPGLKWAESRINHLSDSRYLAGARREDT